MLLLFRRNDIVGFGILAIVTFMLSLSYVVHPPAMSTLGNFYEGSLGVFAPMRDLYSSFPRVYVFLSAISWLGFSLYFKQVLISLKLVRQRDFVPAIALLLAVFSLPNSFVLSVAALAAMSIFAAFGLILGTAYNQIARSRYLMIGAFMGLGALLYWPFVWMIPVALISMLSMRLFVLQEIIAFILGVLFPFYLLWTLHYIVLGSSFDWNTIHIHISMPRAWQYKTAAIVFILFQFVSMLYGMYLSRRGMVGNKVQLIKKWNGVLLFAIASIFIGAAGPIFPACSYTLALVFFSIILCSALLNNHKKYNTFTFYFVFILVLSLQWVLRFI